MIVVVVIVVVVEVAAEVHTSRRRSGTKIDRSTSLHLFGRHSAEKILQRRWVGMCSVVWASLCIVRKLILEPGWSQKEPGEPGTAKSEPGKSQQEPGNSQERANGQQPRRESTVFDRLGTFWSPKDDLGRHVHVYTLF